MINPPVKFGVPPPVTDKIFPAPEDKDHLVRNNPDVFLGTMESSGKPRLKSSLEKRFGERISARQLPETQRDNTKGIHYLGPDDGFYDEVTNQTTTQDPSRLSERKIKELSPTSLEPASFGNGGNEVIQEEVAGSQVDLDVESGFSKSTRVEVGPKKEDMDENVTPPQIMEVIPSITNSERDRNRRLWWREVDKWINKYWPDDPKAREKYSKQIRAYIDYGQNQDDEHFEALLDAYKDGNYQPSKILAFNMAEDRPHIGREKAVRSQIALATGISTFEQNQKLQKTPRRSF